MKGVDPCTLQTLSGWRSLVMVERYGHLSPDHIRRAVENQLRGPWPLPATELDSNLTRLQDEASRAL